VKLYPNDTSERFEFPKVIHRIVKLCGSERGKTFARELEPSSEIDQIRRWLDQTAEAKSIIENGIFFPDYGFPNISAELSKLGIDNAVLEGTEAIKIRTVAEVAAKVIHFLAEKKEIYPALRDITEGVMSSKELIKIIDEVLEPNGFVRTNASKELQMARKALADARQRANRTFEATLRRYKKLGWLREYDESFYNDRRVLAVLAEHKRQIDGTLHGSSESGSTAFIEPSQMVALNNDVAEARQREKREEYRILKALTAEIRQFKHIIEAYEYVLGFVDFTFSKARYALEIDAAKPIIDRNKDILLVNAYHPVLLAQNKKEGKPTIPLTMSLNHKTRILVISGPNAGGKSISLKTLGLLQLMFQSGMLIPAAETSTMGVFRQIFVDIGDDQSIAYELSTYSSRLLKMKHFLMQAHKNTLFFIDEFGTGSDPELGGAMAEVILEELSETGAFGVITTHYANIKIMAENNPVLKNGCMLFDEQTLAPKYELYVGHAGSSYTFEVAQKIGLEKEIIQRAREKLDQRKVKLDQLLITLQTKKNQLNKETSILQQEKSRIRKEIEQFEKESELYRQKRTDLNFSENKQLIERGKKYDALLEAWQDRKKRKELSSKLTLAAEKEANKKRELDQAEKLRAKQERIRKQKEKRKLQKAGQVQQKQLEFKVGDKVKMRSSKQVGEVEEVNKDKVTVVFGMMKTIVPAQKLQHLQN
jgi:DNA mismatch repair protein MutS2